MIDRIRDGILYPRQLLKYAKDKMFLVILYILFFTILVGTKSIINIIKYDGVPASFKQDVINELEGFEGDCVIANGAVTCAEDEPYLLFTYDTFDIYIMENQNEEIEDSNDQIIYLQGDMVYIQTQGIRFQGMPLSDLPESLQAIDFNDLNNGNEEAVHDALFEGLDELTVGTKVYWGSVLIGIEFLVNGLMLFGFVLISAYFLRRRYKVVPFRDCFTLSTYSATSVFILLVFFSLIEVSFFIVLLMIILAFRQNGMMIDEIERRLKKPLDKE